MGYALKLNNVDFSSVALGQVTYIEPIPCTGVSLSASSLSFDSAEESKQLTATITPSDTTDTLSWSSSDENVATVDNTGLVTIHGIGTATITATCGNQTATCSINQTTIKAQYDLKIVSGYYPYAADSDETGKQYVTTGSSANETDIGQANHSIADLAVGGGSTYDIECVRVPYGATSIYIKTSDDVEVTLSYLFVIDTTDMVPKGTKQFPALNRTKTFFKTSTGYAVEYGEGVIFRPGSNKDTSTLSYIYFE